MSSWIGDNDTIHLTRGDSLYITIVLKDADTGETYTPQTGDTVRFACKRNYEDTECVILKEIPTDSLVLFLAPDDTKELKFGRYVYDIQLTLADGDVFTVIPRKKLVLEKEVE